MRFVKWIVAVLSVSLLTLSGAQAAGNAYQNLAQPQPTMSGKKVEIIEFFSYDCPHCSAFDPDLSAWVKQQGDKIVFKRVPVGGNEMWSLHQRMFYALDALGKVDAVHEKIFSAIHKERQRLKDNAAMADFAEKNGIDKKKFLDSLTGFGVDVNIKRADKMALDYKVESVPQLIVNGRYLTSPAIAGQAMGGNPGEEAIHKATLKVLDELVAGELKKAK